MLQLRPPDGEQSVRQLMLLNISCLPISYGTNPRTAHYKRVARNRLTTHGTNNGDECDTSFWTMLAYHQQMHANGNDDGGGGGAPPLLVGAITVSGRRSNCCSFSSSSNSCCRCSDGIGDGCGFPQKQQTFAVQLLTLAVLPVFRRRGVATRLLHSLIRQCEQWANVEKIFLHCQTSNEAALLFYRAHGFAIVEQIPGHYQCRAMVGETTDAVLLERRIIGAPESD